MGSSEHSDAQRDHSDAQRERRDDTQRTRQRREARAGRRRWTALVVLGLLFAMVLLAPTIASRIGVGQSFLKSELAKAGWTGDCGSLSIGWVTPLNAKNLTAIGPSGKTKVSVAQINLDVTVLDALKGNVTSDLGTLSLRGVDVVVAVTSGSTSIEDDITYWMQGPESEDPFSAIVEVSEMTATIIDEPSTQTWTLSGGAGSVALIGSPTGDQPAIAGTLEAVLSDPAKVGGGMRTSFAIGGIGANADHIECEFETDSLPLSIVALARTRLPEYEDSLPQRIGGDATGKVKVDGGTDWLVSADGLQLREFIAELPSRRSESGGSEPPKTWINHQASINGTWLIREDRIIAENVRASTDFANLVIDADFLSDWTVAGASNNPVRWLESVRGIGNAEVDLVAMQNALPGLIPVRDDVTLQSGKITARVNTSTANRDGRHLSRLTIQSDPIQGRSGTQRVRLDPVKLTAVVSATDGDQIRADEFNFQSGFGTASGSGQLTGGDVDFDFDLGRLAAMLQPIFDLGAEPPTGSANGKVRWSAESANQWHLSGEVETDRLSLLSQLPRVNATFDATGTLQGTQLARLKSARIDVRAKDLVAFAELIEPIDQPSSDVAMPLRYEVETSGPTIARLMADSMPESIRRLGGNVLLRGTSLASASQATLGDAKLILLRPSVEGDFGTLAQKRIEVDFRGAIRVPEATGVIDHLTLTGEAISVAAAGSIDDQSTKIDMNVHAKIERLQSALAQRLAVNPTPMFRPAALQAEPASNPSWQYAGDVTGDVSITQTAGQPIQLVAKLAGREIELTDPSLEPASQTIWYEPATNFNVAARWDQTTGVLTADRLDLQTQWVLARLGGDMQYRDGAMDVQLNGQSVLEMDQVSIRLSELAGTSIEADGTIERPIKIRYLAAADGTTKFDVDATLGWEHAEVAGLVLGPADLPIHVNETTVVVQRSAIPVGNGRLSPAGTIYYAGPSASETMWVQVEPGTLAESLDLTPEMTTQWMKYLAPIAASAANAQGTIGVHIDEGTVLLDTPDRSTVRGRLVIGGATMTAGPMIERLLEGIENARSLVKTLGGKDSGEAKDRAGATLVTMPPQEVEFSLDRSVVHHERMYFRVDRAEIFTSGQVTTDGQLDMVAQLPLDARWLGGDVGSLAGRSVSLPVRGNLSSPKVDTSAIASLAADSAVEVGKREVDRFLEKQLSRGFEKLFGK